MSAILRVASIPTNMPVNVSWSSLGSSRMLFRTLHLLIDYEQTWIYRPIDYNTGGTSQSVCDNCKKNIKLFPFSVYLFIPKKYSENVCRRNIVIYLIIYYCFIEANIKGLFSYSHPILFNNTELISVYLHSSATGVHGKRYPQAHSTPSISQAQVISEAMFTITRAGRHPYIVR